ncbi:MAG: GTP cyclohydrolase FolE2 [Opitutales bacterium]
MSRSSEAPESKAAPSAAAHPLKRQYDTQFRADENYRAALPDQQNQGTAGIQGAPVPIMQVGMSGFRLPLWFLRADGERLQLEARVTGTVSLSGEAKGINMSRLMRIFYRYGERIWDLELLEEILHAYKAEVGSSRARLRLDFNYPILQQSLRSDLQGWQYYQSAYEGFLDDLNRFRKVLHLDFVYSSACPCSADLADHAEANRQVYSIPHSQRSKARVSVEVRSGEQLTLENLQTHCLNALKTETQVMVRREDEQAFAELNGAHVKFVEDAARLLYEQLDADARIKDFQVACAHLESLHSHDAVAVINKGVPGGFEGNFSDFADLVC